MMKMLTTAAALAAVLVSAGAAMAAPTHGNQGQPVDQTRTHRGQSASNRNIRVAIGHVERAVDGLQHDTEDYGGHRVAAIEDLNQARGDLQQALRFVQSHDSGRTANGRPLPGPGNPLDRPNPVDVPDSMSNDNGNVGNASERNQSASNANISNVRRHIELAIDKLQGDANDYGGFKEKAIDRLSAARAEMDAALDFVHRRQTGGRGERASNANLRFVQEHVQTAITRLQQDATDYGGHRVAAVNDLQQANSYINSALAFDASHPNSSTGGAMPFGNVRPIARPVPGQPAPIARPGPTGQRASNESLTDARSHVETAIDALSRDAHDYGGFRVKAIDALQAARSQLLQALNFEHAH